MDDSRLTTFRAQLTTMEQDHRVQKKQLATAFLHELANERNSIREQRAMLDEKLQSLVQQESEIRAAFAEPLPTERPGIVKRTRRDDARTILSISVAQVRNRAHTAVLSVVPSEGGISSHEIAKLLDADKPNRWTLGTITCTVSALVRKGDIVAMKDTRPGAHPCAKVYLRRTEAAQ